MIAAADLESVVRSWVGGPDELLRRSSARRTVDSRDFSEETLESVTSDDTVASIIGSDS